MSGATQSIPEVCVSSFKRHARKPAFTCLNKTLTFAEIDEYSAGFASYLQNHTNLQAGDRVAVQLANILQYPVVMYGILRAGMVLVNINPLYTGREVKYHLQDSGARLLIVMANLAGPAAEVVPETDVEQVIITEIADLHGLPQRLLINFVIRHIKKMVPDVEFRNSRSLRQCLKLGAQSEHTDSTPDVESVAVLQYTGGTTGVAKGAMLSHRNLVANMMQTLEAIGDRILEGEETYVAPLPLYHIYAFMIHGLVLVESGNHSILIPNPRDLGSLVKAIRGKPFTGFCGLNTLFNALCHHKEFKQLDFSSLKLTTSGGMALTSDVAELWKHTTGCEVIEGYGLTETSPVVAFNPADAPRVGTVGIPVPDTEVKVVDEKDEAVPAGEPGELLIRGPQVMQGYWQSPEETSEVLTEDGWFRTGDIATISEDGYISIVDRKKDMILVSGFNVYPNEIEAEISQHPGILEVAAIGVPDDCSGEAIKLFVVLEDKTLSRKDIIAFARRSLTSYKIPSHVEIVDELPKSNVGKILRKELRSLNSE